MNNKLKEGGRKIRTAVVGAGFIANFHLESLASGPDSELVAVCDVDLERAQAAARRWNAPHAVSDPAKLAEFGVEVAHVLVPPAMHADVVRVLLDSGVGAFVEKPLALSSREVRELGDLARRKGLVLGAHHNSLYSPTFVRFAERVRSGEIGCLEHIRVCLSVPLRQLDAGDTSHWMFREPRNIIFEQAPHPFAQLYQLAGELKGMHSHALATRLLANGIPFHERWAMSGEAEHATFECCFAFGAPFQRWTIQAIGSDGELEADLYHGTLTGEQKTQWLDFWNSFLAGWRRGGALRRDALRGLWYWSAHTLGIGPRREGFYVGMRDSVLDFYRNVSRGLPPPVTAEDAAEVLAWCESAIAELPPFRAPKSTPLANVAPRPGEVAVLGANGFIGRKLVSALLAEGAPVTAVVRRAHGLPPALQDSRIRLVHASLEDPESLKTAMQGIRSVVHLATGAGADWPAIERSMINGSVALAEACTAAGVQRLVFVSSSAALYLGRDAGAEIGDETPPDPQPDKRPLYARGKIRAEQALTDYCSQRALELVIARPAVVLGPGSALQHSGLGLWVRDNHCVGWGVGDTAVPVVLVDDVADALARMALHSDAELDGKTLNLAADTGLTASEIITEMAEVTGRNIVHHPRPLWLSQLMEIGKWVVKKIGRRADAEFPSWRDLKSRQLAPRLSCRTARDVLGWRPIDDPHRFLELALYQPAPSSTDRGNGDAEDEATKNMPTAYRDLPVAGA